jgi:hypothetical protein
VNRLPGALALVLMLGCGGRSEESAPAPAPSAGDTDAGATDGGVSDPCDCPARTPNHYATCDCPGVTCQFPSNFTACWPGTATCSASNRWLYEYPPNDSCPAELPTSSATAYCSGAGSCEYELDVGCGPAVAKLDCACNDAAWMLGLTNAVLPPLCSDCDAITSEAVCKLYASNCFWQSSGDGACRPPR